MTWPEADDPVGRADARIRELDEIQVRDEHTAYAALRVAILAAREIGEAVYATDGEEAIQAGIIEKLQEWVQRLRAKLAEVARFLGAPGFSIAFGSHVSVGVAFDPFRDGD